VTQARTLDVRAIAGSISITLTVLPNQPQCVIMREEGNVDVYGGITTVSADDVPLHTFKRTAAGDAGPKNTARSISTPSALASTPQFLPKTNKPRPHVCITCMRSFARLDHLRRHKRSHTNEKPFACTDCTKCFARSDLLLRHRQKLHLTTSRPRSGQRDSVDQASTVRFRKISVATNAASTMRPRAYALSHVDDTTIGMLASSSQSVGRRFTPGHSHRNSISGLPEGQWFGYRGMSTSHVSTVGLPKPETSGLAMDLSSCLSTAPPFDGFGAEFNMGLPQGQGNTINHMNGMHGFGIDQPASFHPMFYSPFIPPSITDDDGAFDWMVQGFENNMSFYQANENAMDDPPPRMSTIVRQTCIRRDLKCLHSMRT